MLGHDEFGIDVIGFAGGLSQVSIKKDQQV